MVNGDAGAQARSYRKAPERRAQILASAIAVFAERGVGASLRAIGEAIGVSHAALRYYFAHRDELLVEVYRAHEARGGERGAPEEVSAVALMERSAERNASIPGLVELYATLTTDALQAQQHPETREFVQARFRRVRADLAERVRAGQASGAIAADIGRAAAPVVARSRSRRRAAVAGAPGTAAAGQRAWRGRGAGISTRCCWGRGRVTVPDGDRGAPSRTIAPQKVWSRIRCG